MSAINSESYSERNFKSARLVLVWSFLWGFSFVMACLVVKFWWPHNNVVLVISVLLHAICAIGALKAHQIWLKALDELQQQIQLRSMAFTLGLTWIAIMLLLLLSSAGILVIGTVHLSFLLVLMAVVGMLCNLIGIRKAS